MHLEQILSSGLGAPLAAHVVFTNRVSEQAAFDGALSAMDEALSDPVGLVLSGPRSRRNVLTYYGIGGIGKSRLSAELESRFCERDDGPRAVHRLDLQHSTGGVESFLIGLRAAIGTSIPRCPAFDVGLAAYWERAHPGVAMQSFVNQETGFRRIGRSLCLGEQLQESIEDLLDTPGGTFGVFAKSVRLIGSSVRERAITKGLLAECPVFAPFLEAADPAVQLRALPLLLAWDIAQAQRDQQLRVVVFLDTWEHVQQNELRRDGYEDRLSEAMARLPNVLFVITGRDRLRWADHEAVNVLTCGGPATWPGLQAGAVGEPRQHLVGQLSPCDGDRYLQDRLRLDDAPAIPLEIRQAIVTGSGGLPLYLTLAAEQFDRTVAAGGTPRPDDFGLPLGRVVARVMEDLPGVHRSLLRAGSLLGQFDDRLLRAAVPSASEADLRLFRQRSLVQETRGAARWALHECVREAVRGSDTAADRWSESEWRAAAAALLEDLRERVVPELEQRAVLPFEMLAWVFEEAWRIAHTLECADTWLIELAARLQPRDGDQVLTVPATFVTATSPLRRAAEGLQVIGDRRNIEPGLRTRLLKDLADDESVPTAAREFFTLWLGWTLEEIGRRPEADRLRARIASGDGPFATPARHAISRSDHAYGRFGRALNWPFNEKDVQQAYFSAGIKRKVALACGDLAAALEQGSRLVRLAERLESPDLTAIALRGLAEVECWGPPEPDLASAKEAAALYGRWMRSASWGESLSYQATALAGVRSHEREMFGLLDRSRALMDRPGTAEIAETFHWVCIGELARARTSRARLLALNAHAGDHRAWDVITGWWVSSLSERPERGTDVPVDWLPSREAVRERWLRILEDRRAAATSV